MGIQKIIGGNDIKQGSIISHVDTVGGIDSIAAALSNGGVNNSGVIVDRMKVYRFYSGDSNGLTAPVVETTYLLGSDNDEGYWYRSETSNSNPAVVGYSQVYQGGGNTIKNGFDRTSSRYKYRNVFFRFPNINIAQGANIISAYFTSNHRDGEDVKYNLVGYDADDAVSLVDGSTTFQASDGDWSNHTSAVVEYRLLSNGTQDAQNDNNVTSNDISSIIQEIIDRPGWSSGNSIMLTMVLQSSFSSDEYRYYYGYNNQSVRGYNTQLVITSQ